MTRQRSPPVRAATIAGDVHLAAGDILQGLAVVRDGLAALDAIGERQAESELIRLHGEFLLRSGRRDEGERELLRTLGLSTRRQAEGWRLRAATSLARLRQSQGRAAEAIDLLAPATEALTEGRDTRDAVRATALLAELRGRDAVPPASRRVENRSEELPKDFGSSRV